MPVHTDKAAERLQRKQEEWSRKDKQDLDNFVNAAMTHAQGRKYLYWLLTIGKAIGLNPFTGNALTTSFGCGEQNVGQQIMAHLLEVAPDGFLAMLKEQQDERQERGIEANRIQFGDQAAGNSGDSADSGDQT